MCVWGHVNCLHPSFSGECCSLGARALELLKLCKAGRLGALTGMLSCFGSATGCCQKAPVMRGA